MARIKSVLSERQRLHVRCVNLLADEANAGSLWVADEENSKFSILKNRRWFRKRLRYQRGIHPHF